jgi:hypothetical protein
MILMMRITREKDNLLSSGTWNIRLTISRSDSTGLVVELELEAPSVKIIIIIINVL